jgi:hypothetical protein
MQKKIAERVFPSLCHPIATVPDSPRDRRHNQKIAYDVNAASVAWIRVTSSSWPIIGTGPLMAASASLWRISNEVDSAEFKNNRAVNPLLERLAG